MRKILILIAASFFLLALAASCGTPPPVVEEPPPPPPLPAAPVVEAEKLDDTPPELTVTLSPKLFSPDDDGENDELTVGISVTSKNPIHGWHITIREPAPTYNLFSEWSGEGMPPATLVWDGHSADGELVQSATDYHFALIVTDIYNNSTTYQGIIEIDVLVRKEGDNLRVIVPSIVFASYSGNFNGLNTDVMSGNDRILRRIAEVLNKFSTYKVTVEGHANPTTPPGTTARTNEENGTRSEKGLKPLSEERAKAVVDYLVNLGVARSRLTSVGMGGTRTVVEFADKDNWWKNRRVEFLLVK